MLMSKADNEKLCLTSYWFYADLLFLIEKTDPGKSWLCNNYINIMAEQDQLPNYIYFVEPQFSKVTTRIIDCPFIKGVTLDREANECNAESIIHTIEEAVLNGYCVLVRVNRKEISEYHLNTDNEHQIMIHSFEPVRKEFIFCDNFSTGEYRTSIRCIYSEFVKAYINIEQVNYLTDEHNVIYLLKGVPSKEYCIDKNKIIDSIEDYLSGRVQIQGKIFGTCVYEQLIMSLEEIRKCEDKTIYYNGFSVLYDHKRAMKFRLKKLSEIKYITNKHYKEYDSVVSMCLMVRNLIIKYNMTLCAEILSKCIKLIKDMQCIENKILTIVKKELREDHYSEEFILKLDSPDKLGYLKTYNVKNEIFQNNKYIFTNVSYPMLQINYFALSAKQISTIKIKYKNASDASYAKIAFCKADDLDSQHYIIFSVVPNDTICREYIIENANKDFVGNIDYFRFEPMYYGEPTWQPELYVNKENQFEVVSITIT